MTLKKFALTLLLMTGLASGQGFRWNGPQIVDATGRPVPNATVRVCNEPTSNPTSCDTPSNIYSDRGLTSPLSNPTTADSHGNPHFYALAGRYHIQITDPSISQIDIPDEILVQDGTYPQVNYTAVAYAATETFDASIGTIFALTLTGNVTSSTVSNPSLGRLIQFQICQDGTGGRTFAWPADFDSTPTADARASKCRQSAWFYSGTKWKQFGQGGDSLGLPAGSQITNGAAVLTLPTTTDTLVGRNTTDTLTGKTLSGATLSGTTANSGTISGGTISGATIGATNTVADGALSANVAVYTSGSLSPAGNLSITPSGSLTLKSRDGTGSGDAPPVNITAGAGAGGFRAGNVVITGGSGGTSSSGNIDLVPGTAAGGTAGVRLFGPLTLFNNINTVSNGVPAEFATVDLINQAAVINTTTLYSVPASGAGQYRLSWNSKVTAAAGVSSTLGQLTIVYTDPDGVVVTVPALAGTAAGTLTTNVATNTTATVLEGMPMMLNCKASTNITYSMTYASNPGAAMLYNLHLKLEAQ